MGNLIGYHNSDGKAGIRAYTLILPLNSFCNTTALAISKIVNGAIVVTHPYGRNEIGLNKERLEKALMGTALNPNVYNILLVGYEPKTTGAFVEAFKGLSKKRIESVIVLEEGTLKSISKGADKAIDLISESSGAKREPIEWSELTVGVKCGGSDSTSGIASNPAVGSAVDYIVKQNGTAIFSETTEIIGAEHILSKRTASDEVTAKIYAAAQRNEELAESNGVDLIGTNPVPDNIKGGISTIEEKSLGAILKAGTTTIIDVIDYAEKPPGKGLYFMDSPSAASEVSTALMAAGCQLILFSTGNGNPMGNPIAPVIKVTGNPRTAEKLYATIDVDVSEIITGSLGTDEAGELIIQNAEKIVSGKMTKAEIIKHDEYAPLPVGL